MAFSRNLKDHHRRRSNAFRPGTFELLESRRVLATIGGTVYEDVNANDVLDAAEPRISGVVVYLDSNANGELDQRGFGMDPDQYQEGVVLNNAQQSVFPSGTGTDDVSAFIVRAAKDASGATTGERVFGIEDSATWSSDRRLRFDFTLRVDSVSLDAVGASLSASANVRLDAYAADGELLGTDTLSGLANSQAGRLSIERSQNDISFVIAQVTSTRGDVTYDNLLANNAGSERATMTSSTGFYRFIDEASGQIIVAQQTPAGYVQTFPESTHETIDGAANSNLDFGNRTSAISGIAFNDTGVIGVYEPNTDDVLIGSAVYLDVNRNGVPDQASVSIDPDVFLPDQVLNFVSSDLRISTASASNQLVGEDVTSSDDAVVSPDGLIFAHAGDAAWSNERRLRVDFNSPASTVQIDFIAASDQGPERGTLIAYSHTGEQIASVSSRMLQKGQRESLSINREAFDIAYAVAYTAESLTDEGRLDNLMAMTVAEPVAITNDEGEYRFKPLENGDYRIGGLPSSGRSISFPMDSIYEINVELGDEEIDIDFGFRINNLPPVAKGDRASTLEDQAVDIGVLVNDLDPDGVLNEGSVNISQNPLNGSAIVTLGGFINYVPNENFVGTDTLIYTVRDDQAALSNSAVVTITVTPINDPPVAVDDSVSLILLTPTLINPLANDTDVDSQLDVTTVKVVGQPTSGTAVVDPVTGNITYTPTTTGVDSFTYTVTDEEGAVSNVATITVNGQITGTNPVARDDSATTLEGTRQDVSVVVNDSDADGLVDPTTIAFVTLPSRGTVTASHGIVTYQPELGYVGQDVFTYQVRDDSGLSSNTAKVTIDITPRDFPYQNPIDSLDINADGFVIPRDALIIINEINSRQFSDLITGAITVMPEPGSRPAAYFDVNGDGFIVANDVLRIVNFINAQSAVPVAAAGEPAAEVGVNDSDIQAVAVAAAFTSDFDAFEDDDEDEDENQDP